ncbi:hypothetical protein [Neobacillus jeddahensis]|uniref:hypothetical protein n=1 Tax=Neobacillus jeddahensis TaxID=1461580 RepID=UPI00058D35E0|nr:hypothetical protein [Neobacillus jeddahensis]
MYSTSYTTKNEITFTIKAKEVQSIRSTFRMEFYIEEPFQNVLILNLTLQAAHFLSTDDPQFIPYKWLWNQGVHMITMAAEVNMVENGDFFIYEKHVKLGQLSINQLERNEYQ